MTDVLQWGGRFDAAPDQALLRFGSSLAEDLLLAPFDVACSQAHLRALEGGGIIDATRAQVLQRALDAVAEEISAGTFEAWARSCGAEDIHGAIDARVRELAPDDGEWLHAGRSRNDQVATTLLLYCAARLRVARSLASQIVTQLLDAAETELAAETLVAGTTHWQPAQPVLLAFWLVAAAEPFARDAARLHAAEALAMESCPLGSAALAGSSLPLDRNAACASLGFKHPSRNAMDATGSRDRALDAAHAVAVAVSHASRVCEEIVLWCTPAFGYARLADEASTGSSLMPQKRNPDPFELIRGTAHDLIGRYAGALSATASLALSYHRDLQVVKRGVVEILESGIRALEAFAISLPRVHFVRERMNACAGEGYTVATDVADALIATGVSARKAHERVGAAIRAAEPAGTSPDWPSARASVRGKLTAGSTNPQAVAESIAQLRTEMAAVST